MKKTYKEPSREAKKQMHLFFLKHSAPQIVEREQKIKEEAK